VVTSYPTGSTHLSCLSHTWRPSWGPARSFLGVARETRAVSRECKIKKQELLFLFHMVITRLKTLFLLLNLPLSSLESTATEAARRASELVIPLSKDDRPWGSPQDQTPDDALIIFIGGPWLLGRRLELRKVVTHVHLRLVLPRISVLQNRLYLILVRP